jgi:NAD(P)-dependent dehydrogenase (short-subunit alcohol dehydrogenase family)
MTYFADRDLNLRYYNLLVIKIMLVNRNVINMNNEDYNLFGKSVLITGATSGIGLEAAIEFTQLGALVIGIGRSEERIHLAKEKVKNSNPNVKIEYLLADLAHQDQVHELGEKIPAVLDRNDFDHLDILINNAGVYLERKRMIADGIEKTFAVNHLASFMLTYHLYTYLRRSQQGRILTVTSYSHRTTPLMLSRIMNPCPYIGLIAYKRSKLCNILFTYEFNRRFSEIRAFAVDPGLVNTGIASKSDQGISDWVWRRRRNQGMHPEIPVKTLVYLSAEDNIVTVDGYYFRDCQAQIPSRKARREDLARDLWRLSCQLTNIDWN